QTPVWDTTSPAGPTVQLSWTTSSGATSYQVYRNGSAVGGSLSGTSFYNSTGLTSGQTYSYYVIATGAGGTKQSNTINVGPMPSASMGTLPAAPSSLAALASNNSVFLAWTDDSTDETGFGVERKRGASGSYGQIATTGQGVAAYVDSSVTAGTTYYYRTRAFNSAGNSSYSNEVSATITAAVSSPPKISGVTNPVIGSAVAHAFTISGSNFQDKCNVTL